MLGSWYIWVGTIAATLAILAGLARMVQGLWKGVRALVRFADALPHVLVLSEAMPQLLEAVGASERQAEGMERLSVEARRTRQVLARLEDEFHEHARQDASFQTMILSRLPQP